MVGPESPGHACGVAAGAAAAHRETLGRAGRAGECRGEVVPDGPFIDLVARALARFAAGGEQLHDQLAGADLDRDADLPARELTATRGPLAGGGNTSAALRCRGRHRTRSSRPSTGSAPSGTRPMTMVIAPLTCSSAPGQHQVVPLRQVGPFVRERGSDLLVVETVQLPW